MLKYQNKNQQILTWKFNILLFLLSTDVPCILLHVKVLLSNNVVITASVWSFIAEEEISVYKIQINNSTLSAYNSSSSCKPTDVILKRDRYTVIPSWRIYIYIMYDWIFARHHLHILSVIVYRRNTQAT